MEARRTRHRASRKSRSHVSSRLHQLQPCPSPRAELFPFCVKVRATKKQSPQHTADTFSDTVAEFRYHAWVPQRMRLTLLHMEVVAYLRSYLPLSKDF